MVIPTPTGRPATFQAPCANCKVWHQSFDRNYYRAKFYIEAMLEEHNAPRKTGNPVEDQDTQEIPRGL